MEELQRSTAQEGESVHRTTSSHALHNQAFMEEWQEESVVKNKAMQFAKSHVGAQHTWEEGALVR